jgi:REP element-mobilizing transposase RayT
MPRHPRVHVPGGLYHAILRGNHRQVIFHAEDDYLAFQDILCAALDRNSARLHAYCWMPNHVHLAVQVGEPPLGRLMHLLASRYSRWKQRRVPTTGHLFERRYRAKLVQADGYLLALVRYIHCNPVRAGMVVDAADYPWSSHRAYLGWTHSEWLAVAPTLDMFHNSRDRAIVAYNQFMGDDSPLHEISAIHPDASRHQALSTPSPVGMDQSTRTPASRSLEDIVIEVAGETGADINEIGSARRLPLLVHARAEIARRALREGVATLSEVAVRLGRAPSSLSELLAKYQSRQ